MLFWKIFLIFLNIFIALAIEKPKKLKYNEKTLSTPSLVALKTVFKNGLKKNFKFASVEIVDSPDLTQDPFNLASSGIGGDETIIEYGNDDNLVPIPDMSKVYDLIPMIRKIESFRKKEFFVCGVGGGPFPWLQHSCEGIYNFKVYRNGSVHSRSYAAQTTENGYKVVKMPNNETRSGFMGNIFLTEGKPGKVLKVIAKNRIGEEGFISAMRKALTEKYSSGRLVGVGGVFHMRKGNATMMLMDKFQKYHIDIDRGFKIFQMPAPLSMVGNFVSQESDFKLRLHHFHGFSMAGNAGHFLNDTTPEIVEYEGYFNVANRVFIVDKNSGGCRHR